MPSFLGTKEITAIYWNGKVVSEIYLGNTKVYEAMTQEDDSMFELSNGDFLYTRTGKIFDTRVEQTTLSNGDTIQLSDGFELYVHD